ncbi:MAG: hypothetical protein ACTSQF_05815 [Candidatus Heimdallarchaeaceae archaeon]
MSKNSNFCPGCGVEHEKSAKFCGECGKNLLDVQQEPSPQSTKGDTKDELKALEQALISKDKGKIEQIGLEYAMELQKLSSVDTFIERLTNLEDLCLKYKEDYNPTEENIKHDKYYIPAVGYQLLAHRFVEMQDLAKAEGAIGKALDLVREAKDNHLHCAILDNVAGFARQNNNLDKAIKHYEEALDLEIGPEVKEDERQYLAFQLNIQYRETLLQTENTDKIRSVLNEAKSRMIGDFDPFIYACNAIYAAHTMIRIRDNPGEIIGYLTDAINIGVIEKFPKPLVTAFFLLGTTQDNVGHYVQALDTYKKAFTGAQSLGDEALAMTIKQQLNKLPNKIVQEFGPIIERRGEGYGLRLANPPEVITQIQRLYHDTDIQSCLKIISKYALINQSKKSKILVDRCESIYDKYKDKEGKKKLKELKKSLSL